MTRVRLPIQLKNEMDRERCDGTTHLVAVPTMIGFEGLICHFGDTRIIETAEGTSIHARHSRTLP